ncbi:hypothetical protein HDU98_011574 [Podochytrium sp. JEL0797]|nr:hypothetical protein HDU98_011574 [Podochytrium sp. JEL0797]
MNFLGGYGSGSDSEEEQPAKPIVATKKPKAKTVLLPALPEQLSDDDDYMPKKKPAEESPLPSANSGRSGLFSFLPAPKASSTVKSSVSATTLIPQNLRKRAAAAVSKIAQSTEDAQSAKKQHVEVNKIEEESESFFTFDVPKPSAPLPPPSFKPSISYDRDSTPNEPKYPVSYPSAHYAPSSSLAYAYSESASSSYVYNPSASAAPTSIHQQPEEPTRYTQIHLDDAALHQLGHRGAGGASVNIVDLNHEDQLGGAEARLETIKNVSRERTEMTAFEHLKPNKLAKSKHNIMALAFEAKSREHELKEAYADRRQSKSATASKYGF